MRKIKKLILLILFVTGCSVRHEMPLDIPLFTQGVFEVKYKSEKNLLFVSQKDKIFHFLYQNALGIPLSKKRLEDGVFKSEGFLPPNKKIDHFFIKVLNFIKSQRKKDKIILKNGEMYEIKKIDLS